MRAVGWIAAVMTLGTAPAFAQGDLTIDAPRLAGSWFVEDRGFSSSSCVLVEGCVGGPGVRRLLRFDTLTPNLAQVDLVLGDPTTNPAFVWSPCHGHYHYRGYAEYDLLDALGQLVLTGRKQAFCIEDTERYVSAPWVPPGPLYDCSFQGLQRGWADLYDAFLECQWIDVTNLPAGDYNLRVIVNPDGTVAESDVSNNTATVPVTLPAPAGLPPRPDGRLIPGEPLRVGLLGARTQVDYDASTCPAPDYNLYYGFRSDAWSYSYAGAVCRIGTSGSAIVDLPDPAPGYVLWFLVVGVDPFHTPVKEGGHGFDSSDHERPLSGVGLCAVDRTQSGPSCVAAPVSP
ncbi:MAG TPA: lysyl oxidase family protein [Candidatus Polarisedimenticolia bacterium]|nr:lysyl oxidase family protein [Candidatus Polarisedimenticolia bacterium]